MVTRTELRVMLTYGTAALIAAGAMSYGMNKYLPVGEEKTALHQASAVTQESSSALSGAQRMYNPADFFSKLPLENLIQRQ